MQQSGLQQGVCKSSPGRRAARLATHAAACLAVRSVCCNVLCEISPHAAKSLLLQGRPVYIQQLGQLQFKKLTDLTTEERMVKFHVQVQIRVCH